MVSSSRRKVGDALEEWLTRIEYSIKPSMMQNWRDYAAYYVLPYIGQRDVQDINGAVCDAPIHQAARRRTSQSQAGKEADDAPGSCKTAYP